MIRLTTFVILYILKTFRILFTEFKAYKGTINRVTAK